MQNCAGSVSTRGNPGLGQIVFKLAVSQRREEGQTENQVHAE